MCEGLYVKRGTWNGMERGMEWNGMKIMHNTVSVANN